MKKLILLFVLTAQLAAQTDTLWTKTFGGINNDYSFSVQQTTDYGFIIAGETQSFGNGQRDVWLIKTDTDGDEEWNQTFGGSDNDRAESALQTLDNGFIVVGKTSSFGNGSSDVWLIKTNELGNEEWNRTFGGGNDDYGNSIQQTINSGFIIVGNTISFGNGQMDIWLIKTDAEGNEVWNQTFGGSANDLGYSVQQTNDGGYVIIGTTQSYGYGNYDVWLIKTDADGNEVWNQTFGGSNGDYGFSVKQTLDNGFIIVGRTSSFGNGSSDIWLIKTNELGNEEWNTTFGGIHDDYGESVQLTTNNKFIIAGWTSSFGNGSSDIWLIKTDADGNEIWNRSFGGVSSESSYSAEQTTDNGYIVSGVTQSYGNGQRDIWLIKVGAEGCTDPDASNYNPDALIDDDSCEYVGCTDNLAINFDPEATIDDGSCYYIEDIDQLFQQNWQGVPLNPMGIYVNSALFDDINLRVGDEIGIFDDGECIGMVQLTDEITSQIQIFLSQDNPNTPEIDGFIAGEDIVYKFWDASEQVEAINVNPTILNGNEVFTPLGFSEVELSVYTIFGCTQINSINYNPNATVDDGSCVAIVMGCTDPDACNYNPEANIGDESCLFDDCMGDCGGEAYLDDCEVCDENQENDNDCFGCIDQWALNYNPNSTIDDGSCDYPNIGDISMDGAIDVLDIVMFVDVVLDGEYYMNYMDINQDSYLNIIDIVILVDIILNPDILGCTDPNAPNYNPDSIYDNGSCEYELGTDWILIPSGDFTFGPNDQIQSIEYDYQIMTFQVTNAMYIIYLQNAWDLGEIYVDDCSTSTYDDCFYGYYEGDEIYSSGFYKYFVRDDYYYEYPNFEPIILFDGNNFGISAGKENHPVISVTWFGAWAMASHFGFRLPTNFEWEKAARGDTGADFPWGENYGDQISDNANFYNSGDPWDNGTTPVGYYNGENGTTNSPSPFGAYDMAGNTWEWTGSFFQSTAYRELRGGTWGGNEYGLQSWSLGQYQYPNSTTIFFGFRLARDVE
jgi:formylglycine-generating enzyme required for sulfatase activity